MVDKGQFPAIKDCLSTLALVYSRALEAHSSKTHCMTLARFAGKLQPIIREVETVATSSSGSDVSAAAIAVVMNDMINRVLDLVTRAGATGKCRAIIQAERILAEFQDTTGRLAEALAAIPKFNLQLPEDVKEDVEHLQGQLKRLTYRESAKVEELAAAIRAEVAHRVADVSQPPQDVVVTTPKSAPPDALEVLLRQLLTMAKLLDADGLAPGGKPSMALQFELRDVAAYAEAVSGGSNVEEALLWRHIHTALERIIAPLQPGANGTPTARSHNPPEEFLCPISLEVMTDPVIMVETAMTYDRASIEQHFASGNDNCPLSGRPLVSKRMIPNYNLRSAIESWAKQHNMPLPTTHRSDPQPGSAGTAGYLRCAVGSPTAPLGATRSLDPVEGHCDAEPLEAVSSGDALALTMAALPNEVPALVAELEQASSEVAAAIVRKLCELTDEDDEARVQMRTCNGIQVLVKWLTQGTPASKGMVARALWYCARDDDNSMVIAASGAIPPLVQLLWGGTDEGKEAAARAFWNLSTYNKYNKVAIAKAGAIPALVHLLSFGRRAGKEAAAGALRSLAVNDDNESEIVRAGAIPALVSIVSNGSDNGREIALGALHNLARYAGCGGLCGGSSRTYRRCRNDWRSEVASTGVVEVLRQLTTNPNVRKEVQRQASNLLRRFSTD